MDTYYPEVLINDNLKPWTLGKASDEIQKMDCHEECVGFLMPVPDSIKGEPVQTVPKENTVPLKVLRQPEDLHDFNPEQLPFTLAEVTFTFDFHVHEHDDTRRHLEAHIADWNVEFNTDAIEEVLDIFENTPSDEYHDPENTSW